MNEPEDVYSTIRRAYRYVVAYERRVLDSIARVDEALRDRGFEREKQLPLYTDFPSRSRVLDKWVWDNLPNYARRFEWRFGEQNTAGSRWVLVDHVADTAFEKRRISSGGAPEPLGNDLEAVESSRSILRWLAVSFAAPLPKDRYNRTWNQLLKVELGPTLADVLISEPTGTPVTRENPPLALTTHCVDIAELTDADALQRRFIDPLLASIGGP